jgi:Glycosyl transferase family 2
VPKDRRIHLATVVGRSVPVLRHMLHHYRSLGVSSFYVNVLVQDDNDLIIRQVEEITKTVDWCVTSVHVGDWQKTQRQIWRQTMDAHPEDWFILADQDEFQVYPCDLRQMIYDCEASGWDYITGCQIDRLDADGGFPSVAAASIWQQFPLGGIITPALLGGSPRKVVLARGYVSLVQGQHLAVSGNRCPPQRCFIPVHHFKWVSGIIQEMERRADLLRAAKVSHWIESKRFVDHVRRNGNRFDLSDARLLVARCSPDYPFWDKVTAQYGLNWPDCAPGCA